MNYKRFFFQTRVWQASEREVPGGLMASMVFLALMALMALTVPCAWAAESRSDVPVPSLETSANALETLTPEGLREGVSPVAVLPRANPLEAVQGVVKTVLSSALETVQSNGLVEAGMASWYGSSFQGRRTASGERFDMNQLTAAHKTLPLGTVVQVRNPLNGKTVEVTINDRGPFIKGRIIDLSYRAALALGIVQTGNQSVEVHRR